MTFIQYKRAVGVFPYYQQAENALTDLRNSGFPMARVSLVAKDTDHRDVGGVGVSNRPGDGVAEGAKTGAVTGGVLGGLVGLIRGLTALTVPGIGPVVAGGTLATILGDTLVGGAIGAATGGLIGALVGLGIPEERARVYNERLSKGDYLVMVEGTEEEIRRAQTIFDNRGIRLTKRASYPARSFSEPDVKVSLHPAPQLQDSCHEHQTRHIGISSRGSVCGVIAGCRRYLYPP